MGVFIILVILALLGVVFFLSYLSYRTSNFPVFRNMTGGRKKRAWLICFLIYLAVCAALTLTLNLVNTVICLVHLGGFWLLSELVFLIIRKKRYGPDSKAASAIPLFTWLPGVCAIIFTVCYMLVAWYLCTSVREKDYTIESDHLKGDLRIVQFADSHVGATFDAEGLHNYVLEINALNPDIVLITGDFVDDDTSREDMLGSCEALGDLNTKYGVFFSYGNHDKGYFSEEARGWSNSDLYESLVKNGVIVLQDDVQLVDGRFYVIGRQDKSESYRGVIRKTPAELMEGLDPDLYKIVLDHQPAEYREEALAGADLVLSGHTHGGQFFPFNQMGVLTGEYDRSYGHEQRDHTDFIVTSGISDWSLIFKTGCRSEYVVIDIHGTA
jgi:predicted MPP superfamily phosphohydrolase